MKLKLNEQGFAVVKDGQPVYVYDDGKEIPFDAPGTVAKIRELNGEAKTNREAKEAAEAKLVAFADIDPAAAKKALETVRNLDDKKLVDAGKVEEVRRAAREEYETKLKNLETSHAQSLQAEQTKAKTFESALVQEMIGGAFQRSAFIKEKVVIPPDLVQAKFGAQFKVVDGKMKAFDAAGNSLFSRKRPGDENIDFEEAIEIIIDSYPQKAAILKGDNASGAGTKPGAGGGGGGKQTITRTAWQALPIEQQGAVLKDKVLVDG